MYILASVCESFYYYKFKNGVIIDLPTPATQNALVNSIRR